MKQKTLLNIGIPKTAGKYLYKTLDPILKHDHYVFSEHPEGGWKKPFRPGDYFIFAILRNPLDLLVSYYEFNKIEPHLMDSWARNDTFPEFIHKLIERTDSWPAGDRQIFFQIYDDNGKLIPEYIGTFENLEESINDLIKLTGCTYEKTDKINTTNHKPYQEYYTEELEQLVRDTWSEDFKLWDEITGQKRESHNPL